MPTATETQTRLLNEFQTALNTFNRDPSLVLTTIDVSSAQQDHGILFLDDLLRRISARGFSIELRELPVVEGQPKKTVIDMQLKR